MTQILICTVGGSHQPIVTAVNDLRPDFVLFICTDKDPATGRPGSAVQITGSGNCIKAAFQDDKPSLPNIPAQTGLTPEQYDVCTTLSDDLDQIYADCNRALDGLVRRFPNASIMADYTGGTKSMSAGLVMAAMERQGIQLQLVTGSRADLVKVYDGSQYAALANIEQIRFERQISPYRQAWSRFAYGEAEAGLKDIRAPNQAQLRSRFTRFRDLSRAFSEWDNFNHQTSLDLLQNYAPGLPNELRAYLPIAMRLRDQRPEKREPAQLLDLYLNARRRAAQGRYDDAVARVYRLIEWTAQWLLKSHCGIDTSNIAKAEIPAGMELTPNREGVYQAGLFQAWQLVKVKTQSAAAEFIQAEEKNLLNQIKSRNQSILAHGFEPVQQPHWLQLADWLEKHFLPMLLKESRRVGIKDMPPQLPQSYDL
ncbi:MAG: TIGR02710 family CRISPR-associated protein [Methylomicrobium sp.]|nr:TIGR02710 family CRISPR-associated protein [Methylomicrobium sp.]